MDMSRKEFLEVLGKGALLAAGGTHLLPPASGPPADRSHPGFVLRYRPLRLELKHAWTLSRGTSHFKENVFVELECDGVVGLGEAAHNVRYGESLESTQQALEQARPLLERADPWVFVDTQLALRQHIQGQNAAKAALDMAMLDWVGKKLGVPLYRFWGLDPRKAPQTTYSIGIDTPEVIREKVKEAEPYPILKIKMGAGNDEEILRAVRQVTDKPLRVDANEGWRTKEEAIRKIEWLAQHGVEFVEQPMPAAMLEETAWVRERSPLPIIADESVHTASDIPKLAGVFDGVNIKVDKAGGLQEAYRAIWMAKAIGLKTMLGCMIASSLSITAAAHLSPLVDYADLDGHLLIANDPYVGVEVRDGWLILPERPGIGVVPRD
ncbi:MAG: dipeptide epimerase [candidate division KSB1 bacterium]|nr:dipeptide epimerase [candidate division KSB1 bacterium]